MEEQPHFEKVIYDFGMNEGLNIDYYLKKGFPVVGVEANPLLCKEVASEFSMAIKSGQLRIENCALSNSSSSELVDFYIHKFHSVLSQFPQPALCDIHNFNPIKIKQRKASDIIKQYGEPYYIKIDIEHCDHVILLDLFANNIKPPYLSSEIHKVDVFAILLAMGYETFNLVDGPSIDIRYRNIKIETATGIQPFSFKTHSAGPFGVDLKTPWLEKNDFNLLLIKHKLGWKDVHATTVIPSDRTIQIKLVDLVSFSEHVKALWPSFLRAVNFRLLKKSTEKFL